MSGFFPPNGIFLGTDLRIHLADEHILLLVYFNLFFFFLTHSCLKDFYHRVQRGWYSQNEVGACYSEVSLLSSDKINSCSGDMLNCGVCVVLLSS